MLFDEYVDGKSALVTVGAGRRRTDDGVVGAAAGQQRRRSPREADAAAAVVQSFAHAPEVYAGPLGALDRADDAINASITPLWGEAKSLHWTSDKYQRAGLADLSGELRSVEEVSDGRVRPRRSLVRELSGRGRRAGTPCCRAQRLLRAAAEPARQLRQRRGVHAGQRQGLRLRRPARHRRRRRRGGEERRRSIPIASASSAGATAAT